MAFAQVGTALCSALKEEALDDRSALATCLDQVHGIAPTVLTGMLQVLGREERSLASLLDELCGVHKQKQHQRADWRQRCVLARSLCPPPVQHLSSLGTPLHIRND